MDIKVEIWHVGHAVTLEENKEHYEDEISTPAGYSKVVFLCYINHIVNI